MNGRSTPTRDANRELARSEFETGATVLRSRPRALFVELTRHCNLSCPMCRNPGEVPADLRMDEPTFARVEAELFPTADMIDLRGWGESLILPEFADRARRASAFGAALRVVTNLSFRRDDLIDLLAELEFHVGVSIDSADAQVLAFLRRGASLDRIEQNLKLLSARYQARGIADRLNLYVTCQRPALPKLADLVDFAQRVGIHDIRLAPVGTGYQFLSIEGAEDELARALDTLRERAERARVRVSFTASLVDGMFPRDDAAACLHPWTWCYVSYSGRLGFCDHLLASDHYTFGSLADTPFEEIWNSAAWTTLREEHLGARRKNAPHFTECAWCYKNRYTDCENIVEPAAEGRRLLLRPALSAAAAGSAHVTSAAGYRAELSSRVFPLRLV